MTGLYKDTLLYYKDEAKLIADETTGCKSQYISSVGVCDPTLNTPKKEWVYPGEYQEDTYIAYDKHRRREMEKAGRQNGGEDGVYIHFGLWCVDNWYIDSLVVE